MIHEKIVGAQRAPLAGFKKNCGTIMGATLCRARLVTLKRVRDAFRLFGNLVHVREVHLEWNRSTRDSCATDLLKKIL